MVGNNIITNDDFYNCRGKLTSVDVPDPDRVWLQAFGGTPVHPANKYMTAEDMWDVINNRSTFGTSDGNMWTPALVSMVTDHLMIKISDGVSGNQLVRQNDINFFMESGTQVSTYMISFRFSSGWNGQIQDGDYLRSPKTTLYIGGGVSSGIQIATSVGVGGYMEGGVITKEWTTSFQVKNRPNDGGKSLYVTIENGVQHGPFTYQPGRHLSFSD